MKTNKFKKYDKAFTIQFGLCMYNVMGNKIKVINIRVIDVEGANVIGETHEMYGYLKTHKPGDKNIYKKNQIKRKGKEVEFRDDELVAVVRTYKSDDLLTESEMKLEIIDYVMDDFQTRNEYESWDEDDE